MRNRVVLFLGRLSNAMGMFCCSKYLIDVTKGNEIWFIVGLFFLSVSALPYSFNNGNITFEQIRKDINFSIRLWNIAICASLTIILLSAIFGRLEENIISLIIGLIMGIIAWVEIIFAIQNFSKS